MKKLKRVQAHEEQAWKSLLLPRHFWFLWINKQFTEHPRQITIRMSCARLLISFEAVFSEKVQSYLYKFQKLIYSCLDARCLLTPDA